MQFESRQGISATPGTFQHVPAGASNTDNDDYPLNEWFKITIDFERFPDQVGTAKLYVNDVEKAQVSLGSDAQYSSDTFIRNQHFPQVTAHWLYNTTGWNCYVAAIAVNTGASGVEDWRLF